MAPAALICMVVEEIPTMAGSCASTAATVFAASSPSTMASMTAVG